MSNIESNDSLNGGLEDYNNNSDLFWVKGLLQSYLSFNGFKKEKGEKEEEYFWWKYSDGLNKITFFFSFPP